MANILSTANSALTAAQQGLATTAHNIANARTPGYHRQVLQQAAVGGQDEGGGFIGKGTEVVSVQRVYNEYLASQLRTVQTSQGQLEAHYTQANRINNMMADPSSGLSPVLQDFFQSVQNLAANPDARGSMLASGQSLAARFQSMDGQLRDLRVAVNSEISTTITAINSYAQQIADLNNAISKAQSGSGQMPNDLLDQRDYLVGELSKLTKVTVSKDGANYGIFIGNGQPMVVGSTISKLAASASPTDLAEVAIGIETAKGTVRLSESSLQGGKLGGLFEFRSTTLTDAQNQLGRIAVGLATTFNDQHKLGLDRNGAAGGDFFNVSPPLVSRSSLNIGNAMVGATITDVSALKASDYKVTYDGSNFSIVRMADNVQVSSTASIPSPGGITVDGINFTIDAGTVTAGDQFVVKPTINAAAGFKVVVTDLNTIACAAPIATSTPTTNSGTASISAGTVDKNFTTAMVSTSTTMVYDAATGTLNAPSATGFPFDVKVTDINGASTIYPAGTAVPYSAGATVTFGASLAGPPADVGGISVQISGAPGDGDKFVIGKNTSTSGDNRNMVLLGNLQTANTLVGGTTTYQGALSQLVSMVGNKTHELNVGNEAQTNLVTQLEQAQDADSGVNLDEEGANLLRYQQAYVAAGKVMQAVKEMFDMLVQLGRA
ncbi:MAG TPA: flagellar hook-associated protein FlgK [Noviherbaspirillum sp.]|nr:flagellar hook-associated protein FlgK [Noviherbaspirillum sp.]